jgi:hypothetical protein
MMSYQEIRKTVALVAIVSAIGMLAGMIEGAIKARKFVRAATEQADAYEREVNAQFKDSVNG